MKKIFKYIVFVLVLVSFANAGVPTVTIDDNVSDDVTNQDITFTFTFSEGVDNFTKDDIDVTNGTKGDFTGENNDTNFTLVVTPNANFEGNVTVDVDANVCTSDSTDENNTAATQAVQTVDTLQPTVTSISLDDTKLSKDENATVTIVFSEAVQNFNRADIKFSDGNLTEVDSSDGNITFTAVFTPNDDTESNSTIYINGINDIKDIVGNDLNSTIPTANFEIDTKNPSITNISISSTNANNSFAKVDDNITLTFTVSETLKQDPIVKIADYNATVSVSGNTYTAIYTTQSGDTEGNITYSITDIIDTFDNNGTDINTTSNIIFDETKPSISSITLDDTSLIKNETTTLTITFSETVDNFDINDITITDANGSLSNETMNTNHDIFYFMFTPNTDTEDANNSFTVNISDITDSAGNELNSSATTSNFAIDTYAGIVLDTNISGDNKYINADEQTRDLNITGHTIGIEENQTITLGFAGNTYDVNSTSDGNFTITVPSADLNVTDGLYSFDVNVTDVAGNYVQDGIDITVDTSAHINIDPITGDGLISQSEIDSGITITGDNDIKNGDTITILLNGVEYNGTAQDGNYSINISSDVLQNLAETTYVVQTKSGITDEAGNVAPVTEVNMTIDKYSSDYNDTEILPLNSTIQTNLHILGGDIDLFKIDTNGSRGKLNIDVNRTDINVSLVYFGGDEIANEGDENLADVILDKGVYFIKVVGEDENVTGDYNITTTFTPFDLELDKGANAKLQTTFTNTTNITSLAFVEGASNVIKYNGTSYYDVTDDTNLTAKTFSVPPVVISKITTHNSKTYTKNSDGYIAIGDLVVNRYKADDFYINNDTLYTISTTDGLNIYDITDDTNIKLLAHKNIYGSVIIANDRYVYIGSSSGLRVVNIHQDFTDNPDDIMNLSILPVNITVDANNYAGVVDTDIFKIIVNKSGDLNITSSNVAAGNELNITIAKDVNFTDIVQDTVDFNNTTISNHLPGGRYFVKIIGNANTVEGNYTLSTVFTTSDTKIDKVINYTLNGYDINATANTTITSGVLVDANDTDLYKIYIPQTGILDLNVSGSNKNIDLVQYDINSSDDFSTERNITNRYLSSGLYYIKITGDSGDYNISTSFASFVDDNTYFINRYSSVDIGNTISAMTLSKENGEVVINDTSNNITIYDTTSKQKIAVYPLDSFNRNINAVNIDQDQIKVYYNNSKLITLDNSKDIIYPSFVSNTSATNPDGNITQLTIAGKTYIATSSGIEVKDSNGILLTTLTYIRNVKSLYSFGENLYAANGTKLAIIDISSDYSNYKLGSSVIYPDHNVSGGIVQDDVDYFKLILNSTGELNITIDNSDVNCSLYKDGNNTNLGCSSAIRTAGTYYIKLENNDTTQNNRYNFYFHQAYDDHLDSLNADGNMALTSVTVSDSNITGNINIVGDKDSFKIYIDGKNSLSIDNLTNGFEAKLYYPGGIEVEKDSNGKYIIPKEGEYYIQISSSTTTGDYSYTVSLTPIIETTFVDDSRLINKTISTIGTNGNVKIVKDYGDYLYILDDKDGFMIVDISNINAPTVVNKYIGENNIKNILVDGNYVYLSKGDAGVEILDISDKNHIESIMQYNTAGDAKSIAVNSNGDKIYIADGSGGLTTLDITDKSNPTVISTDSTPTNDVIWYQNKLYKAQSDEFKINARNNKIFKITSSSLNIYDLNNLLLGSYSVSETINNINIVNGYAYLTTNSKLYILNISDATSIKQEKVFDLTFYDLDNSASHIFYATAHKVNIAEISPDYSDTFKSAKPISYDLTIKGQIIKTRTDDVDIFVFDTNYSGKLSITSSDMEVNGKISIYDSTSTGMAQAVEQTDPSNIDWNTITPIVVIDNPNSNDVNITDLGLDASKYYVVFKDASTPQTGGAYSFKLKYDITNDKYINILTSQPTIINPNGGVIDDSLVQGGNDIDFVDINITDRMILTFTNNGDIKPQISLYFPDGTLMNQTTDENISSFQTEINPGIYKVKINGFDQNQSGNYKITLSTEPIDDVIIDNGLSKVDIDNIIDVKYLNSDIYTLTKNGMAKYSHLLKQKSQFDTNFDLEDNKTNQTNANMFVYNDNAQDKVISYITTTDLAHLKPIVSSLQTDTFDTTYNVKHTLTSKDINSDTYILPYLNIKYISKNKILYMYDGSTLQIRQANANTTTMQSYPIGDIKGIKVISNTDNDIVYVLSGSNGGYLTILDININDFQIQNSVTMQLNGDLGGLYIDQKTDLLYIGISNELKVYDISDKFNPTLKTSYSFKDSEYEGTPSDIYIRESYIYLIIPAKGIIILKLDNDKITLSTTILNLGEYIDHVYSADGRTVNYTVQENNTTRLKVYFFEDTFSDGESDSILSGTKDGIPKEGCFIATAAYGSYFQQHVKVLRDFRDNVLLTNDLGRYFVKMYYKYSPAIATQIATSEVEKSIVRIVLTPIVYIIKYPLYGLFLLLLLGFVRFWYSHKKGVVV